MKDSEDFDRSPLAGGGVQRTCLSAYPLKACLGKLPNPYQVGRLKSFNERDKVLVALLEHRAGLQGRQFVGSQVPCTRVHEDQRAIIGYEMLRKKSAGSSKSLLE